MSDQTEQNQHKDSQPIVDARFGVIAVFVLAASYLRKIRGRVVREIVEANIGKKPVTQEFIDKYKLHKALVAINRMKPEVLFTQLASFYSLESIKQTVLDAMKQVT